MTLANCAFKAFALLNDCGAAAIAALTFARRIPATHMPHTLPSDQIAPRCEGSPREQHRDEMIRQGLMS